MGETVTKEMKLKPSRDAQSTTALSDNAPPVPESRGRQPCCTHAGCSYVHTSDR